MSYLLDKRLAKFEAQCASIREELEKKRVDLISRLREVEEALRKLRPRNPKHGGFRPNTHNRPGHCATIREFLREHPLPTASEVSAVVHSANTWSLLHNMSKRGVLVCDYSNRPVRYSLAEEPKP